MAGKDGGMIDWGRWSRGNQPACLQGRDKASEHLGLWKSHGGAPAQLRLLLYWLLHPLLMCSSGVLYLQLQPCRSSSSGSAISQFQLLSTVVQKTVQRIWLFGLPKIRQEWTSSPLTVSWVKVALSGCWCPPMPLPPAQRWEEYDFEAYSKM